MNRKQRRALAKSKKAVDATDKIASFSNLPNECSACVKPFDKTDREQVNTWSVVVRDTDTVRLYCPECWSSALEVVKQYEKDINQDD